MAETELDQMDERQRTIAVFSHELLKCQKGVRKAQVMLRTKAKESEAAGISWPEIRDALRDYRLSRAAREERMKRQAEIYTALGAPAQLELFDSFVAAPNDSETEAWRKGWFAAIYNEECSPPYEPGTIEGQAWMRGHHDFHGVRVDIEAQRESEKDHPSEERNDAGMGEANSN